MGRLLAWLSGAAGGIAAYRLLARRRGRLAEPPPLPAADPRAEELRAKLERHEDDAAPVEPPAPSRAAAGDGDDPEARRRRVHERARAAVDEMRRAPGS